jgi:hypothetical protein
VVFPDTLTLKFGWFWSWEKRGKVRSRDVVSSTCLLISCGFIVHGLHVTKSLKGLRILH